MISIKRLLERHSDAPTEREVLEASLQMGRLLLDAISSYFVVGRDADNQTFGHAMNGLVRRLDGPPSAFSLLEISSEAVDAIESYAQRTAEYFREQNEQLQSMVAMLTETLADISGQNDESIARLQAVEQQIVRTSGLDDMRALSASLESCLAAVREAAVHQRKSSAVTAERLRGQIDLQQKRIAEEGALRSSKRVEIDLAPEPDAGGEAPEVVATSYVAVLKLLRADHIATRFGTVARNQMLSVISQTLKTVLGPNDRLLRWKGTSFVMFLNSSATIYEIRVLLAETVGRTGQHFIDVGKKTALISVGVDWIVFPRTQCPSLDAVFAEVDSFLASDKAGSSPHIRDRRPGGEVIENRVGRGVGK